MESVLLTMSDASWIRFDIFGAFCRRVSRNGTVYMLNWKLLHGVPKNTVAIEYTRHTGEVVIIPISRKIKSLGVL